MVRKKYLWKDGRGKWRVRIKGKTFPLRDDSGAWHEPGTEEGDRLYWEIRSGRKSVARHSFNELIASYRKSDRWTSLAPRTKADYEKVLSYLQDKVGDRDATTTRRIDILNAMGANSDRVRFANYIQQVARVLFEHAIDIGWIQSNPAADIKKLRMPVEKERPHRPWPDWAVKRFREEARPLPRLIFELGVGSVQRPGDWVKFRWSDFDGKNLALKQGKTRKELLSLPCTPELRTALDTVAEKNGLTILTLQDGRPMSYRRMAQIMRDERNRLGLEAFDQHALRYRGVMELAWAACEDEEIAAYSGHTTLAMIRKYAGLARQITRANSAAEKRRLWAEL